MPCLKTVQDFSHQLRHCGS